MSGSIARVSRVLLKMRAVRVETFGGPDVLQVKSDLPIPEPADDEVLIRMKAVGVNPVETYIRTGTHALKPSLPYTPGSDGAGTIEKVGSLAASKFKVGDRAFIFRNVTGSYAEYATVKASCAHPLPSVLDFKQGAALGVPYFTAYRALHIVGNIQAGQSILVHGASGAVGNGCIQIAKARGLTVYGTAGSQQGLDLIKRLGVDHAFNHREEGYERKIMEATGNKGVDHIAEMLSNINLQKDLNMLALKGTVLAIGSRGDTSISPRTIMAKEARVLGVMLGHSSQEELKEIVSGILEGIEAGHLAPVIAKEYPLEQAAQAHHDIINTTSATGKLVLVT